MKEGGANQSGYYLYENGFLYLGAYNRVDYNQIGRDFFTELQ
jgi:hypothetical protein